jgi:hypothetical protein
MSKGGGRTGWKEKRKQRSLVELIKRVPVKRGMAWASNAAIEPRMVHAILFQTRIVTPRRASPKSVDHAIVPYLIVS